MKQKIFFIIFKGLSVAKNFLKLDSAPLIPYSKQVEVYDVALLEVV